MSWLLRAFGGMFLLSSKPGCMCSSACLVTQLSQPITVGHGLGDCYIHKYRPKMVHPHVESKANSLKKSSPLLNSFVQHSTMADPHLPVPVLPEQIEDALKQED